jgi:uncharacterized damage-inducible protein DinB
MLSDAFAHHAWANLRLLDACQELPDEQLSGPVPGTYGSILDTFRHLVDSDGWYFFIATGDRAYMIEKQQLGIPELRTAAAGHGAAWARLLGEHDDPETILREVDDDDGYERRIPIGVLLAQALHHGTDHRSQVCTALTALGVGPPDIDLWAYGDATGRVVEILPPGWPAPGPAGEGGAARAQ